MQLATCQQLEISMTQIKMVLVVSGSSVSYRYRDGITLFTLLVGGYDLAAAFRPP